MLFYKIVIDNRLLFDNDLLIGKVFENVLMVIRQSGSFQIKHFFYFIYVKLLNLFTFSQLFLFLILISGIVGSHHLLFRHFFDIEDSLHVYNLGLVHFLMYIWYHLIRIIFIDRLFGTFVGII